MSIFDASTPVFPLCGKCGFMGLLCVQLCPQGGSYPAVQPRVVSTLTATAEPWSPLLLVPLSSKHQKKQKVKKKSKKNNKNKTKKRKRKRMN